MFRLFSVFSLGIFAAFIITGCVSYKAIGVFQDYNEVLYGTVKANLLVGGSNFSLKGENSGLTCDGSTNVTYIPPFGVCRGQKGDVFATCSDGRSLSGEWFAQSCTRGFGKGKDSYNNIFAFTFGMPEEEARERLSLELDASKSKPELPGYRPKETREEKGYSTGTGFFVTTQGHVVTNFHVIEDAKKIAVITNDGSLRAAAILRQDSINDIAVLKVEYSSLPLSFSESDSVYKGSEVMTLGYPLVMLQGQEQKATFGRVNSYTGMGGDIRFLQIDVPIQPGNSGGPLISRSGRVVGVVTATLNQIITLKASGSIPQNVNYAVKSEYVVSLLEDFNVELSGSELRKDFEGLVADSENSIVLVVAQ